MERLNQNNSLSIFNSPFELGLRALFVLNNIDNRGCDLDRLVSYDYLLLHSGDINNGPNSLHPSSPFRSTEILIKRELMRLGLNIMIHKELVSIIMNEKGILYSKSELTIPFCQYFDSNYATSLKILSEWIIKNFHHLSDKELNDYIQSNIEIWGGEYSNEALIRETYYE